MYCLLACLAPALVYANAVKLSTLVCLRRCGDHRFNIKLSLLGVYGCDCPAQWIANGLERIDNGLGQH